MTEKILGRTCDSETVRAGEPLDDDRLQQLDATHSTCVSCRPPEIGCWSTPLGPNELLRIGIQTTLAIEGRAEQSRQERQLILDALFAGDSAGVGRAAGNHVKSAGRTAHRSRSSQEKTVTPGEADSRGDQPTIARTACADKTTPLATITVKVSRRKKA